MRQLVTQPDRTAGSFGESVRIVVGGVAVMLALVLVGPLLHLWCLMVMGWALVRAPLTNRSGR